MDFVQLLFESLNALGHKHFDGPDVELVVSIGQDKDQYSYYFVDHDKTSIFWLRDLYYGDDDYPYALLMWAMVSFIAVLLPYVFKSGVSTHSEIIIGSLALALGVTLIWVIQFFWKDDLKLKEDLQSLCNILTQLSPLSLFHKWRDI
ncbi:hypothetical protein BU17DRAFT_91175 [Hysterangium stoloniferum]|nr:hypothetical protein BU17DRAFT_91175 [Hysterangium stoloniferum]